MQDREIIIDGLRELIEQETTDGLVDGVSQELIRDTLALLAESRPERIILRVKNWIRMDDELLSKTKSIVNEQLENGDKTIIVPNVFDVVYVPEGLEVQML